MERFFYRPVSRTVYIQLKDGRTCAGVVCVTSEISTSRGLILDHYTEFDKDDLYKQKPKEMGGQNSRTLIMGEEIVTISQLSIPLSLLRKNTRSLRVFWSILHYFLLFLFCLGLLMLIAFIG